MMTVEIVLYNEKRQMYAAAIHFSRTTTRRTPPRSLERNAPIVIHEYPSVENDEYQPVDQGMNLFSSSFLSLLCAPRICMKATAQILFCLGGPLLITWKSGSDKVHQMVQ